MADSRTVSVTSEDHWMLGSEEVSDEQCQSCSNVGEVIIAQGYCVDCGEFFCGKCCRQHKMFNVTKTHVIKDISDVDIEARESRLAKENIKFVKRCSVHTSDFIKLYCLTCNTLGCSVCMATEHRVCESVLYIPDIIKNIDVEKDMKRTMQNISLVTDGLTDDQVEIVKCKKDAVKIKTTALHQLEHERQKVNMYLDTLGDTFKTQTSIIHLEDTHNISRAEGIIHAISEELKSVKLDVKAVENEHVVNKFIVIKAAQEALDLATKRLKDADMRMKPRR